MEAPKSDTHSIQRLIESYGLSGSQIPIELLEELISTSTEMQFRTQQEEERSGSWFDLPIVVGVIGGVLLTCSIALGTASHTLIEIAKPYLTQVSAPTAR